MSGALRPDAAPAWLRPLLAGLDGIAAVQRREVGDELAALSAAAERAAVAAGRRRDAAVLALFSGAPDAGVAEADLLLTVRAGSLRQHAGQAAFPGGAADPTDGGPVHTALREAGEETGVDPSRLVPVAVLAPLFVPPSGFRVSPVLAWSPDPGPVGVVDPGETAAVARVGVATLLDPAVRLRVRRPGGGAPDAGPAFLLPGMLVWGFTGLVVATLLEVAGWTVPWDTGRVLDLDEAMAAIGEPSRTAPGDHYGGEQP